MSPSSYTNKKAGVCIFYVISYEGKKKTSLFQTLFIILQTKNIYNNTDNNNSSNTESGELSTKWGKMPKWQFWFLESLLRYQNRWAAIYIHPYNSVPCLHNSCQFGF